MMKLRQENQGFVSLFTCIMISLLLLVITISLVSLEALQLRKAEDAEQTLRAYYTAEAGVEDAVSKVLSQVAAGNPLVDQTCTANTNYDIPGAAGWTCQQISFSGTPFGKLSGPPEEAAQTVDPGKTTPAYNSVILEWNQSSSTTASQYNVNIAGGLPTAAAYTAAGYAASPIELAIVQYPDGGFAAGSAAVKLQNALIVPGGPVGQAGATVNYATLVNHGPWRGDCRPLPHATPFGATSYNCYAVLSGFDTSGSTDYLFRIRSRYMASAFKMTFLDVSGNVVKVPDGTATIDVTARAGQTYRRVISKLPLGNGGAAGLNYVMYSDTDICKNFDVIDNVAQPGCPY